MNRRSPLGEFLMARRAQLSPDDVGLPRYGYRRRVPGLRREELAMLAEVSAGCYTRLEQGQSLNASAEVLDAIATALHLTTAEREHLHVLSTTTSHRTGPAAPPEEHASADLRTLLAAMGDVPALVVGRRNDVLAWERSRTRPARRTRGPRLARRPGHPAQPVPAGLPGRAHPRPPP
ncbi:helix-turn-helix domain-containing protein [Streptomyces sp. NPDC051740]|uniref:helix-turn-helix domain-containing protein n=1 Tax=Streptomyces sp. NPDC051740 TaxID=3365673 RepID=UPI0037A3E220